VEEMASNASLDQSTQTASLASRFSKVLAQSRWLWLLLFILILASSSHDFVLLTRHAVAVGIDGYYYVLQVGGLLESGHLHFPRSTPGAIYFLAGLSRLTGNVILAIKLGSIILHALLCLGIFALLTTSTRSEWLGVAGAAMVAISGLRFYMLSEFIASLAAITLLVWCGWCAFKFFQCQRKVWAIAALILCFGALLSHRLSLAIVLGAAVFTGLLYWLKDHKRARVQYTIVMVLIGFWLSPAILATQKLVQIPERLKGELSIIPRLPFDQHAAGEEIMLLLASASIMFLLTFFKSRLPEGASAYLFGSVALWSLIVTLNPFLDSSLSMALRLRGLTYIQAAILVPGLIWYSLRLRRELVIYIAAIVLPTMLLSMNLPLPRGMQSEYVSDREELISALTVQRPQLDSDPFVIAAHGDEFVVTAVLDLPSSHFVPAGDKHKHLYWLLDQVNPASLTASPMIVKQDSQGGSTVLMDDANLRSELPKMSFSERRHLFSSNPHLANAFDSGALNLTKDFP
jgi:hypothetical protein